MASTSPARDMSEFADHGRLRLVSQRMDYHPISPTLLWRNNNNHQRIWVVGAWLMTLLLSIALGLASIIYEWSGLPVHFGGVDFNITLYPPLVLCLFWVLWFGFWWGFIPAYLATLVLALYSDMSLGWALLFAFADPLGLAVFAIAYRAIPISFCLRSLNSILIFILLSFVSGIFGSSGSFIWTYTNQIALYDLLPIWQGWWLGAFLQNLLVVMPLLMLFSPSVLAWRDRQHWFQQVEHDEQHDILKMTAMILLGVLLYIYVTIQLAVWHVATTVDAANEIDALRQSTRLLVDSMHAIYWVVAIIIGFFAFFGYQVFSHWSASVRESARRLLSANATLEFLSKTDSLTGLYNRRTWEQLLALEYENCRSLGRSSVLLLLDIDHFKHVNDRHGHLVGDEVLRAIATCINANKRDTDVVGRYGGEEFIVLLPDTDRDAGLKFAERLRQVIEKENVVKGDADICFTASLGLAEFNAADSDCYVWLAHADKALYQAKTLGRNTTVLYSDEV